MNTEITSELEQENESRLSAPTDYTPTPRKVKVKYDNQSGLVKGYYPSGIKYNDINEESKLISSDPYIEITKEQHESSMGKVMCVVEGVFQEYVKTNDELLAEAKAAKKLAINKQRDLNKSKDLIYRYNDKDYCIERNINSELAWLNCAGRDADSDWVTKCNTIITISKADFRRLSVHIGIRDTQETMLARKRKDAVEAMTTIEEVEAYDITTVYE